MFPAEIKGEWEPLKYRERRQTKTVTQNGQHDGDSQMEGDDTNAVDGQTNDDQEDEILYEEDPLSEEGAVYPLQGGRVVNWSCFFALFTHVYNTLSPPFHTPIIVVSQPAWTAQDHESLTQFFFEKFKTPAFCLMDSALAVCYAYSAATATVIDVGHEKCDVSAVSEFLVNDIGRGAAIPGCGGEALTDRLLDLLKGKGFTRDMCDQLKKNAICEILPAGTNLPTEESSDATTAAGPVEVKRVNVAANTDADQEHESKEGEDDEGVLDVATIVASGKTSEFLARKEREKAEKAAAKKTAADAAAATREARLPNSRRPKATLQYHERRPLEDLNLNGRRVHSEQESGEARKDANTENGFQSAESTAAARKEERKEERRRNREGHAFIRKHIDVGVERFQAASGGIIDQIADAVHRCILSVPDASKRADLWDSLVIVGNGSRVRGKDVVQYQKLS